MNFTFVFPGWEGSASDGAILEDAKQRGGFMIPDGMVDILDAGFALSHTSLTPYRSVRYHLKEWKNGRERYDNFNMYTIVETMHRPQNAKELYNLRHAQLRNVVERIFAVWKKRFPILMTMPAFNFRLQVKIFRCSSQISPVFI